jgi:hypothetical protein
LKSERKIKMRTKKITWGVVVALVIVGLLSVGQLLSQPAQRGGQGQGQGAGMQGPPGQGPGGRMFDPEQMRQMMEQRMKEMLGATDEEWKVLGPRVMKVQELNRQTSGPGRGMMMFGRGMRGGPGGPGGPGGNQPGGPMGTNRELTETEKIQEQLQTLLEDTTSTPDKIKEQLTKLRAAREKDKAELAKAQKSLREVLTLRQEATLVLMGMLD